MEGFRIYMYGYKDMFIETKREPLDDYMIFKLRHCIPSMSLTLTMPEILQFQRAAMYVYIAKTNAK